MAVADMYRSSSIIIEVLIENIESQAIEYYEAQSGYRILGIVQRSLKGASHGDRLVLIVRPTLRDRVHEGETVRVAGLSWRDTSDAYVVFALLDEEKWDSVSRAASQIDSYGFDLDDPRERRQWEKQQHREQIHLLNEDYQAEKLSLEEYLKAVEELGGYTLEWEF